MPPQPNPGTSGTRRVVRRKPKPPARQTQQARTQQAAYGSQGRAVQRAATQQHARQQTQRAARQARPLAARPVAPKPVPVARPPRTARPLAAAPPANVRAGKPVTDAKQRRAVAVTAYNQLSGDAKRGHLAGAQKRVQQGKASETDVAILHAHDTRVEGNRKRVAATKAFNAIAGDPQKIRTLKQVASSIPDDPTNQLSTGSGKGLNLKPGHTYGPARKDGSRPIRNPAGKEVGVVAPLKKANVGSVANLPSVGKVVAALGPLSTKGLKSAGVPKVIANIPKDLGENVITSPTSLAKFAVDTVKHPGKTVASLAKPYEQLAKDPKKFVTERPVTTALMLSPAARTPGRIAGKGARLAGKQTLARPTATLEGTALREARTGSRSAGRRALQARQDAKRPTPSVSSREIDRRVDEAFAVGQKHAERVRGRILHDAQQEAKQLKLDKAARKLHMEAAQEQARNAIVATKRRRYALEFGATPKVENGHVVAQPNLPHAHLHDTAAEAHMVRDHLNAQNQTILRGPGSIFEGGIGAKLKPKEKLDVKYRTVQAGSGKFAVMPDQAAQRLNLHGRIGKEKAVPAVILRQSRRALTRTVLPTRPSWLTGQTVEPAVRGAVRGVGPLSYLRAHLVQKRDPDLYQQIADRAVPGGAIGRSAAHEMTTRTLAQEIPDSQVARSITEWGQKPGIKQTRDLYDRYTRFVFDHVNGKVLEAVPQKAFLGRAMSESPLMERKVLGLFPKAIDEFVAGARGTETHVELGREVAKGFGKYSAFSPRLRSLIMHWTPFIPWWLNSARFVLQTLPRDHPIAAAVTADINAVEEDWRKQQGLSLRYKGPNSLPPWMLGGYPVQGGKNLARLGHYVPGGSETDPVGALIGQVLPQFSSAYGALRYGKDWKDADLKHADGTPYNTNERMVYAVAQMIESMVPFTAQGAQVLHAPEMLGGPSDTDTTTTRQRALKQVNPISTIPIHRKQQTGTAVQVKPVKVKPVKVRPVKVSG